MTNGCRRFNAIETSNGSIVAGNALLATGVQTNLLLEGLGVFILMTTPLVSAFQYVLLTNLLGLEVSITR